MTAEAIKPGSLSTHLIAFCRFLRSNGFTIGPQEELEMFTVLVQHPFEEVDIFKLTLTQLLCKSRQQQLDFPGLFDQFWQELFKSFGAKIKPVSERAPTGNPVRPSTTFELKKWLYNKKHREIQETAF